MVFTAEAERDQHYPLIDAEPQSRQDLGALLADVRLRDDQDLSLLRSSQNVPCYVVFTALHDYFCPVFNALRKHTEAFHSASRNHVQRHAKKWCVIAPSFFPYPHRSL